MCLVDVSDILSEPSQTATSLTIFVKKTPFYGWLTEFWIRSGYVIWKQGLHWNAKFGKILACQKYFTGKNQVNSFSKCQHGYYKLF